MLFKFTRFIPFLLLAVTGFAQSPSFETYMNPVIPGDHPDPTLFKWGDHFFTTRSSFNTTPKIYHSTDLVHWEVSSKPIDPGWSELDDCQACGIWGGSIEYFAGYFWEYFGLKSDMWFVKAESPFGPWSEPVRLIPPPSATEGFGRDNSIFVDDDGTAYLLAKPGQQNNQIFKLRADGQCTGEKIDLGWMNPAPDYPLGWAEGPVMCKKDGYYYYFIAENAAGGQYVYRTQTLIEDESAWEFMGSVFNYSDRSNSLFYGPNHMSYPVELEDGTWWTILHSWQSDWNTNEWKGQGGRQGLLSQVYWDENGKPTVQWPVNRPLPAPDLPSSGIPWMVPKSDFFESAELHAGWEFFGRTPASMYSLSDRPGWFRMKPGNRLKSLVKNDAEHAYALLTRVDFEPTEKNEEAGLRITNGLESEQNIDARLHSGYNGTRKVIRFKFQGIQYETENTAGNTVWLRIVRSNHILTGYFSADGMEWTQVGNPIDVSAMDENQPDYNGWLGNRQGIYAENKAADFDLYIYRDAYSPIMAHSPANQLGTSLVETGDENFVRGGIHDQDWVLYPGVEFGNMEYTKLPAEAVIEAASASDGGRVEIWVDSIGTGTKIGECSIENTGGWDNYQTFTSRVKQITGRHDVYLHFKGGSDTELLRLKSLQFISKDISAFRSAKLEEPSVVQLQLTVPVNLPEESVSGLTVNVNHTPINITNYSINESDSTWMIIQVENPVDSADLVTISYQEGNLYTNDSAYLKPFENKLVDNLLPGSAPRLVFAETNMEGTTIEATFNKPMEVPDSSYKFFSISTGAENPESIDITSVSNKDNDPFTLVLQPKQTLYAEYHIALNYSGSSLSSFDGGRLAPVTGFQVKNNAPGMPLTIVSSTIQNGGLSVALEFNKTLQAQSGQEAYFAVKVNGAIYQVQEITFSQSTLSILTDIPIRHGDTVFVTYAGGEISAIDGGILSDFTDKAITNNLPSPNYQHIPGKIEAESAVINNRAAIINATDTAGGYVAG
ncbi:MAG: family 43 glycosylhydrolase, partial [Bacteroidota bacterium]